MDCINCGERLNEDASFCHKCGTQQIEEPVSPQMPSDDPAARRIQKGLFFLDNWLVFTALGVLATITTILFIVGLQGAETGTAARVMQQFCLVGPLAVAAMVSTRTGGLDLSTGGIMALSSMIFAMNASAGNGGVGFVLALIVCGAVGILNGLFIMVLRMPAVLVTIASAMLTRGIAMWAGGISIELPAEWMKMSPLAAALALLISVGIAVLLLWRTGGFAKKKKTIHGQMKFFWIYGLIALIGMISGWAASVCFGTASTAIGAGSSNEMILLFVFATISASVMLKNNWVALAWTLLLAMLWTIHDQAMILLELNPFSMIVSNASWVFILLAVMAIAKRSWEKPVGKMLTP